MSLSLGNRDEDEDFLVLVPRGGVLELTLGPGDREDLELRLDGVFAMVAVEVVDVGECRCWRGDGEGRDVKVLVLARMGCGLTS